MLSGRINAGVDHNNRLNAFVSNRANYCSLTCDDKHCKEWCTILARRMSWFILVMIQYICGVLKVPIFVGNIGGTGVKVFFYFFQETLKKLPPSIQKLEHLAKRNCHDVSHLVHFSADRTAVEQRINVTDRDWEN